MKLRYAAALSASLLAPVSAAAQESPRFGDTAVELAAGFAIERTRELVIHALALMGVRYRYGGDSPDAGFDCSGLVRHVVSQAAGILLPRNAAEMSRIGQQIARDELQPGDLVFFNTLRRPYSHVGIYLGGERFIHAPSRGGAVEVVDMSERYWLTRYNGGRRLDL
jgi:cell wall-associated NlpC family hydrolase